MTFRIVTHKVALEVNHVMQTLISTDGEVTVNNGNVTADDNNVIDRIEVQSIRIYTAKISG